MREFDHERMAVYQRALEFVRLASTIRSSLAARGSLADQLDRACVSIALNIAEGAGEFAKREKARFYRIARRSATECAAILDVAIEIGALEPSQVDVAKQHLREIVAMLIALGKRLGNSD
jgi:four helix bundle protein